MIDRLITFGDSFTAGYGVGEELAWPSYLGKMLGLSVINHGVPGGSNRLSIIKLLNTISTIECPENVLVGFSWTTAARTCFYNEETAEWKNIIPHWKDKDDSSNKFSNIYYGSVYNDIDALTDLIIQQVYVTSFLKQRNIKFFFINSLRDVNLEYLSYLKKQDNKNEDKIQKLEKFLEQHREMTSLVDKDLFVLEYDQSIKEIFCDALSMYCEDNQHPNAAAHHMTAGRIFWFLHDRKILIS
jgi:hypothetical protein